jgi:catechol 2,3-dioxygenase-like lactoylglutathione lyase family enzyme
MTFLGVDHLDIRVTSLAAAEEFYDAFLSGLGLVKKTYSFVDSQGIWTSAADRRLANVAEYFEETAGPGAPRFIGIIEDPAGRPSATRIAFRVGGCADLERWATRLVQLGARSIEWSDDLEAYPALFFEDPCGTRLELCARVRPPA